MVGLGMGGACSQCQHENKPILQVLRDRELGTHRSVMMQRRAVGHAVREIVAQQGGREYRATFESKATHAPELQSFAVFDRFKRYHRIDGSYDFHLLDGGISLQDHWESAEARAAAIAHAIDEEEALPRSSTSMGFSQLQESLCGMISFSSHWGADCRDDQCGVSRRRPLNVEEECHARSHSCVFTLARPAGRRRQQQLFCHSSRSGRCLFRTCIDPAVRYQEIGWNTYLNTFWCISGQKGRSVAVFAAQPFRLLAKFSVTKEAFGPLGKVESVNLTLDVLCLAYKLEKFVLYSLPDLISRFSVRSPAGASTRTGYLDTLSIQIEERVNPIRVVECGGQMLYQMPYLLAYDSTIRLFSMVHMRSNEAVDMTPLLDCLPPPTERNKFQFEDIVKLFAYDHMQRFVLKQATRLDFFCVECSSTGRRLTHLHTITDSNPFKRSAGTAGEGEGGLPRMTSSGRSIPTYNGSGTKAQEEVLGVDYEDDLDVITVTMRKGCFMYSNTDGRFLRYVPLGSYWAPTGINVAVVDCTTLVFLTGKEHRIGSGGDYFYRVMALQQRDGGQEAALREEELLVRNEAEVDAFDGENDSDFDPNEPF